MHTLAAAEIKRRGVVALEESLKAGPVHIIKNNQPTCVVLSEKDYENLLKLSKKVALLKKGLSFMLKKPVTGTLTRDEIDKNILSERESWDDEE